MRIAFQFDAAAWGEPRARWTIEAIAPLLDTPWRALAPGGSPAEGEAPVWVGDPTRPPATRAVTVAYQPWPDWRAAEFERVMFDGVPMAAPASSNAGSPAEFGSAWLHSLWHVLSREEERQDPRRDQWECFSGRFTRLAGIGLLETPWVNLAAGQLRASLEAWCAARATRLESLPRWKNRAPFAVALSHDVDDVRLRSAVQALRLLRLARSPRSYALRGGLSAMARAVTQAAGPDPYSQFERWVEEEARRGFGSTFFVFSRQGRTHELDPTYTLADPVHFDGSRRPVGEMFASLGERGFEIGLHGSYLTWRDAELLGRQRERLAAATGRAVTSARQHFLRFDVGRTLEAQERAGFANDATLGYNEAIGFRAGVSAPFHPWDPDRGRGRDLLEIPLTLMDGALFRALALTPEAAIERTLDHLAAIERVQGLGGLLWHPNAAAEALFPGWWACFVAALDHLAARGAWVASVGEIAEWWRERERRLSVEER